MTRGFDPDKWSSKTGDYGHEKTTSQCIAMSLKTDDNKIWLYKTVSGSMLCDLTRGKVCSDMYANWGSVDHKLYVEHGFDLA